MNVKFGVLAVTVLMAELAEMFRRIDSYIFTSIDKMSCPTDFQLPHYRCEEIAQNIIYNKCILLSCQ